MSKVICDICGTVYQDTADSCPICGYSRIMGTEELDEDFLLEEAMMGHGKGGRFSETNVKKKNKEIFDYDEVNPEEDEEEEEEEASEEEEEEYVSAPKANTAIVIILIIVIMLLLAAIGFVFMKFFLPNITGQGSHVPTTVATEVVETEPEETTEPTIPCTGLILSEAPQALSKEGQFYLLNVQVKPADTTDSLVYTSGDESIVTVTVDGRITAVGEGETTVYITCGNQQINCPVTVKYVEETQPATEETVDPTAAETVEETVEETTGLKEVTLKLEKSDITLTVGYGAQLKLDCDLDPSEVEWSVEHDYIATVDETGFVKAVSYGTTAVTVKYGDQEVQCIIRCK